MSEHSPEPWKDYEKCPDMFFTADGVEYSLHTMRSSLHEDTWMWQEMRDVQRIVACVNALAHLPTHYLEWLVQEERLLIGTSIKSVASSMAKFEAIIGEGRVKELSDVYGRVAQELLKEDADHD